MGLCDPQTTVPHTGLRGCAQHPKLHGQLRAWPGQDAPVDTRGLREMPPSQPHTHRLMLHTFLQKAKGPSPGVSKPFKQPREEGARPGPAPGAVSSYIWQRSPVRRATPVTSDFLTLTFSTVKMISIFKSLAYLSHLYILTWGSNIKTHVLLRQSQSDAP